MAMLPEPCTTTNENTNVPDGWEREDAGAGELWKPDSLRQRSQPNVATDQGSDDVDDR
jgi:hypothetical protein